MVDLSAHSIYQLVEIGYDTWLIVKPGAMEAEELVDWLLSFQYIVKTPEDEPEQDIT